MKRRVPPQGTLVFIVTIVLVVSVIALVAASMPQSAAPTSKTSTTAVSSRYLIADASGNPTFSAECASPQAGVDRLNTLVAGTSSPAIICVQLYELSPSSPILLNLTSLLSIQGSESAGLFNEAVGDGNFTVVASQDQLLIGGPSNVNEGVVVGYSITAKPNASGTYGVGFPGWLVGSDGGPVFGSGCTDGELVAGSGLPNYFPLGGCFACESASSSSSSMQSTSSGSFTIPGAACAGNKTLIWAVIKAVNSTQ